MNDQLIRAISGETNVRALACLTTYTTRTACERHQTRPTASVALSRALTGGVLLGALLKGRERVALKFEGNGPLRKIVVEADALCRVHGYVGDPGVDLPLADGQFDIASALGRAPAAAPPSGSGSRRRMSRRSPQGMSSVRMSSSSPSMIAW